jgi:hypothetical protein
VIVLENDLARRATAEDLDVSLPKGSETLLERTQVYER